MQRIKVGIIGITGYAGLELLRLLQNHPSVEVVKVAARSGEGQPIEGLFPGLVGTGLKCVSPEESFADCEYVFLGLPHGVSMNYVPRLLAEGVRVIDLGADFRFTDQNLYAEVYGQRHAAGELLGESVYGLCEYQRDLIRRARIVGNPGCYPTASLLALKPLLDNSVIDPKGIVIDAKSGVSGAGRGVKEGYMYTELNENFRAYKVIGHRHSGEIRYYAGPGVELTFTPHLLPVQRGILATLYLKLADGAEIAQVAKAYQRYEGEAFVTVHPLGKLPELRWAVGSNSCHLGYDYDPSQGRLIVVSVIDNLIKGAAGQGIQNLNIMANLPEAMGLARLAPVV